MRIVYLVSSFLFLALPFIQGQSWDIASIGMGVKPDFEIDSDQNIHFSYLSEAMVDGYIDYGQIMSGSDSVITERLETGLFIGPVDLELSSTNAPIISYNNFVSENTDLEIAVRSMTGVWSSVRITNDGDDGFDASMVVVNDIPNLASVNLTDQQLELITAGSGQAIVDVVTMDDGILPYYGGTDIIYLGGDDFGICYHTITDSTLYYATNVSGSWVTEAIAKNATNGDLEIDAQGNINIAYVVFDLDSLINSSAMGTVELATRSNGTWSAETITSIPGFSLGALINAQEVLDLEYDSNDIPHISYATSSSLNYANKTTGTWVIQVISDIGTSSDLYGQQTTMVLDSSDNPHIGAYLIPSTGTASLIYAKLSMEMQVGVTPTITCPADTLLACGIATDTSVTGIATATGNAAITFVDSVLQDCPEDLMIMRSWIATDSIGSDTCIQMITQASGSISDISLIADTLMLNGMCITDAQSMSSDSINLSCSGSIDSITFTTDMMSCESVQMTKTWHVSDDCLDTTLNLSQTILISDIPVINLLDTTISSLTDSSYNIDIAYSTCDSDSLSFLWSDGSTSDSLSGVLAGNYSLLVTNQQGCADSFMFTVAAMDTSVMMTDSLIFICPADTTIDCEIFITPDITGLPTVSGYDTSFFFDNRIQDCPDDIILERFWVAQIDSTVSDTCMQMITVSFDSLSSFVIADTLRYDGICFDDLSDLIRTSLDIPCNVTLDSINFSLDSNSCDLISLSANWVFDIGCSDSVIRGDQVIIIDNPIVAEFSDALITTDSVSMLSSIDLEVTCPADSISFLWSNGAETLDIDSLSAGVYTLNFTNQLGCSDSIEVVIAAIMMDTFNVMITCPADTSISCSDSFEPSITGMASATDADTIFYIDTRINSCPIDTITRTWIATNDAMSDTCTQIITVVNEDFSNLMITDTITFTGLCAEELEIALDASDPDLPCGFIISGVRIDTDTVINDIEYLSRGWTISDTCRDSIALVLQTIEIIDEQIFKIENIAISSDNGDTTGIINYDIICAPDSISFLWSDGSMDTTRTGLAGGEYSLVISDDSGVLDSLSFTVETMMVMTIECPSDTTVSCDSSIDPMITGSATSSVADTIFYIDSVIDTCPSDMIITRQWIAADSSSSDTCSQTITVLRNGFETLSVSDTMMFSGICADELDGLLMDSNPTLSCGINLDTSSVVLDTTIAGTEYYTRSWTLTNACMDSTLILNQIIVVSDIQSLRLDNISVMADDGDSTGMITFDIICAPDSISFLWSDGSMDTTRTGLAGGDYTLSISDTSGIIDSLSFTIESDIAVMITCPSDTTVSCDSAIDPVSLGMASAANADTLFFTDSVIDTCPSDMIITRQWIASNSTNSDTCNQIITVLRNGFETLSVADTIMFSGICSEEFDGLLMDSNPTLSCGINVDTSSVVLDTTVTGTEYYTRSWTLSNACMDSTIVVNQTIVVSDIQTLKIDNSVVTADDGDTTGMISFDIICAPDSISFLWSDGSIDTTRTNLLAGEYQLTVSDTSGVLDSFSFSVPLEMMVLISCPADTTISCDSSTDPIVTGSATATNADTIVFSDSIIDTCSSDIVITRQWIASNGSNSDTCAQTITILRNGFETLTVSDTIMFSGICAEELEGLLIDSNPVLSCGITVDTTSVNLDTTIANTEYYTRSWTLTNVCMDSTIMVNQTIAVSDIQTLKLDSAIITSDDGTGSGAIDFNILCSPDSVSFLWSDGSVDTTRMGLAGGDYQLTISDTSGVIDSFDFFVPTDVTFSLSCPSDTIISCDSSLDPFMIGEPVITGYDSVRFVDTLIDSCPGDLIINRDWIAMGANGADTCTQQITVQRNGLSLIDVSDSETLSGLCIDDLLDESSFDLACGIMIDTIILNIDSSSCGFASVMRTIDFTDTCLDSTMSITQNITLTDVPVARVADELIVGDVGDSTGMIDLTLVSCSDSISLLWSTGATTEDIDNLAEGFYSLTVSDTMGCVDTLQYTIPFVDTTAFFINIRDRNGDFLDVDSISTQRSSGGAILSEVTRLSQGQYQFTTNQTIIGGDQICMELDQDAAVDLSVLDLIKGQRHILGLDPACEDDLIAGDVNFTGNISGADLAAMQRVILALSTAFPDGRSWTFVTDGFTAPSIRKEGCVEIETENLINRTIEIKAIKLGNYECD